MDTTWLESINNVDNEYTEFGSGTQDNKIQSLNSIMHREDNDDDKSDDMNTYSDTFHEIDEHNLIALWTGIQCLMILM